MEIDWICDSNIYVGFYNEDAFFSISNKSDKWFCIWVWESVSDQKYYRYFFSLDEAKGECKRILPELQRRRNGLQIFGE